MLYVGADTLLGFMVVRKEALRPARSQVFPDGWGYRGRDREPWEDVELAYYDGGLPIHLREAYDQMEKDADDFNGIYVTPSVSEARELLHFSNSQTPGNELIAVASDYMERRKPLLTSNLRIDWLGYDVLTLGSWSLIAYGVLRNPAVFANLASRFNQYGLVDDVDTAAILVEQYCGVAEDANLEIPVRDKFFMMRIGEVV